MHILKLKQTFILLLISLCYLYGIWLPQGKAENGAVVKDSQQIPTDSEKKKEPHTVAGSLSLEKSSQPLQEENLQKKPLDENYRSVIAGKEVLLRVKEKNTRSFPFSQLLFTTSFIDRQLQSQEEKGTQTVTPDTRSPQAILEKGDPATSTTKEEDGVRKELSIGQDQQSIITEKDFSSNNSEENISQTTSAQEYSVTSTSEIQSPSIEERGTQTPTIDEKSSLYIAEKKISPTTDTADTKNSQENPFCNDDDQIIVIEKEFPSVMSTTEPSTPDEEGSLIEKEKGTQTSAIDNEQQKIIPDEENTSSSEEEKLLSDHQANIIEKNISQDIREEHISSAPSEPPATMITEKESPDAEDEGTQTTSGENRFLQGTSEERVPSTSLGEPSNKMKGDEPAPLNKDVIEFTEKTSLQKPLGEITKQKEELKPTWKLWHSDPTHSVILAVAITLIAAKIGFWVARMVRLPGVVGKLIIGMVLGNMYFLTGSDFFNFFRTMPFLKMISYFGTLVLLLTAGLNTDLRALFRVGASSFLVCLGGVIAPAGLGIIVGYFLLPDASNGAKLLLAIILCNSSTGLLLAILSELKAMNTLEGRVIAGATILTDIVAILTFGVVSGVVVKGGVSILGISVSFGIALFFLVIAVMIIFKYGEKFGNFLTKRLTEGLNIPIVVILSLLLAFMFGSIGLHTVIGAFIAGLFLRNVKLRDSDDREHRNVESFIRPFYILLIPILFVRVGAQVDLKSFLNIDAVLLGLAITGAAVIGKMFCSVCPIEKGINRLAIGIGMTTKLEGSLILAGIGRDIGILSDTIFSSIIMVIVFTSTICPFFMKILLHKKRNTHYENICINTENKELEKTTVN